MAVTAKWYGNGLLAIAKGTVDWDAATVKVMLTTSSYTPNQDTHDFRNDVTNEISGTGYSAGGVAITPSTPTYDSGTNEVRFDATDASWSSATFTARYAVVYVARGGASSADELLFYVDFGEDKTVSAGTFLIQWDGTSGAAKIVVS